MIKRTPRRRKRSSRLQRRFPLRMVLAVLGIMLVLVFLRACIFHTVRIEGSSMSHTLQSGDIALVTSFDYHFGREPSRGDIVECRFPNRSDAYIKRVIGLPGETVEIRNGETFIDGAPYPERYVSSPAEDYSITLGEDEYLVLGDNRADSYDSRAEEMGPIGKDDFLGRVRFILWPPESLQ